MANLTEQDAFLKYCTRDTGEQHDNHVLMRMGAPYEGDDVLDDEFDDLPEVTTWDDDGDDWPTEDSDVGDVDIDVCVQCGRYYATTDHMVRSWRLSPVYRDGDVMPQLCEPCLSGKPPRNEY